MYHKVQNISKYWGNLFHGISSEKIDSRHNVQKPRNSDRVPRLSLNVFQKSFNTITRATRMTSARERRRRR